MGIKKELDIYIIGDGNNRAFLKAEVNGRVYQKPLNLHDKPEAQCAVFTKEIWNAEKMIAMHESKDFYDYMFKFISGQTV